MKKGKNFIRVLFLGIFVLGTVFSYGSAQAREQQQFTSQLNVKKVGAVVVPGTLFKIEGRKGAAVYSIGIDGKKNIYPTEGNFRSWHDDFSEVIEVSQEVLDSYEDGGMVTFRPGGNFITTRYTNKVYVLGKNGLIHIPDETTARKFYGDNWQSLVRDIDPGVFAASYNVDPGVLSETNLPEDAVILDETTKKYYIIQNNLRREISLAAFAANNFQRGSIIRIKKMAAKYADGEELDVEEEGLSVFDPGVGRAKALICHKGMRTLSISVMALPAHLAHGSTEGACEDSDDDDEIVALPLCDHNGDGVRNLSDVSLFASCQTTFDANGDGVHTLEDLALYATNNQDNAWCATNFVCDPATEDDDVEPLAVCDLDTDGDRDLADISAFASCEATFDVNNDGVHDLVDVSLYSANLQDDEWCATNFVCVPHTDNDEVSYDDLSVSISVDPSNPRAGVVGPGEYTTITVNIMNTGSTTLTSNIGIIHLDTDFEDFNRGLPTLIPSVSVDNPLEPGETTYSSWKGYFTSEGTKELTAEIDVGDFLNERDETNNTYETYITVEPEIAPLAVCDLDADGDRDLADLSIYAGCQTTFDVDGDGVHNLVDISLYASNMQDNDWCFVNFICDPNATSTQQ